MDDEIFIPDAVSTADLMNRINEIRKHEEFGNFLRKIMTNDKAFADFFAELFSDESDDEKCNTIIIKFGGVNYIFTAEELAKRVLEYNIAGNYVNKRVLQVALKESDTLTEEEEMEFFEFISENEKFLEYCVQQRKKNVNNDGNFFTCNRDFRSNNYKGQCINRKEQIMNLKIDDVIEVTIRLEADIPNEDWDKGVIYMDKYDKKYSVDYSCQRTGSSCSDDFTVEAGFTIDDEIDSYIKEDLPQVYPEIADYEIFDINKDDFEYQTAKIRIKALKE